MACDCPEVVFPVEEVVCPRAECPEVECPEVARPETICPDIQYPLQGGGSAFLIVAVPLTLLAGVGLGRASLRKKVEREEATRGPGDDAPITPRRKRLAAEQVAAVLARREARLETQSSTSSH